MGGIAQAFLDLFTKRGWGTQVNLKGKLVEVWFVYRHEEIVSMNNTAPGIGISDLRYN